MAERKQNRQAALLGVLVVLTAVALWVNRELFMPEGGAAGVESERVALGERIERLGALPALAVDPPDASTAYRSGRDLFEFARSPAQLRAKQLQEQQELDRKQKLADQRKAAAEAASNRPPPPPPKPPEPTRPDFRYSYVAYLGEMDGEMDYVAVLQKVGAKREPKKEDILVVKAGEQVGEDFVVRRIDIDEVELGYVDPRFQKYNKVVRLVEPREEEAGRRRR